jgi:hypothetical protein
MKLPLILKTTLAVAVLWIVALVGIHILHVLQPTALSIAAWCERQAWGTLSADERARRLAALADQMNQLSFAERQKLTRDRAFQSLTKQMTDDEKLSLMDKTLPRGFAQLMDAFNKMKPEDRKRIVAQALENMKKWNPQQQEDRPKGFNDAAMQKVVQTGFSSYLQDASADTKLDLAPLVEQMQVDMQGLGR